MLEDSHCVAEANTLPCLWSCWNGKDCRFLRSTCWRIPDPMYSFADRWPPTLYALYTLSQQYYFPDPSSGNFTNRMTTRALVVRACVGLRVWVTTPTYCHQGPSCGQFTCQHGARCANTQMWWWPAHKVLPVTVLPNTNFMDNWRFKI